MGICLFCTSELAPGSEEHVFPSSIGGRLCTRNAICQEHNNWFARKDGGKIDDELAEVCVQIRCALSIWSGRKDPPPTIKRAGRIPNGPEYDLAPGFIPLIRPDRIPDLSSASAGTPVTFSVSNVEEGKRFLEILRKRGLEATNLDAKRVVTKVPRTKIQVSYNIPKTLRAVAKSAAVGMCVLYGNEIARKAIDVNVLSSIMSGYPDIREYAGFDFTNEWPTIRLSPHPKTLSARPSGFEHSLVVMSVGESLVAYINIFGKFKFSVRLGSKSELPAKGLALNPRLVKEQRLHLDAEAPQCYRPKSCNSFLEEHQLIMRGIEQAHEAILSTWQEEDRGGHRQQLEDQLLERIAGVGNDEGARAAAINRWVEEKAVVELGGTWLDDLDRKIFLDEE